MRWRISIKKEELEEIPNKEDVVTRLKYRGETYERKKNEFQKRLGKHVEVFYCLMKRPENRKKAGLEGKPCNASIKIIHESKEGRSYWHSEARHNHVCPERRQVNILEVVAGDPEYPHFTLFFSTPPAWRISSIGDIEMLLTVEDQNGNSILPMSLDGEYIRGEFVRITFVMEGFVGRGSMNVKLRVRHKGTADVLEAQKANVFTYYGQQMVRAPPSPEPQTDNLSPLRHNDFEQDEESESLLGKRSRTSSEEPSFQSRRLNYHNEKSEIRFIDPHHGHINGGNEVDIHFSVSNDRLLSRLKNPVRKDIIICSFGDKIAIEKECITPYQCSELNLNHNESERQLLLSVLAPEGDQLGPVDVSMQILDERVVCKQGYWYEEEDNIDLDSFSTQLSQENDDNNNEEEDGLSFSPIVDFDNNNYDNSWGEEDCGDILGAGYIHYAAAQNRLEDVKKYVMEEKGDFKKPDKLGFTPLDVARYFKNKEVYDFLLSQYEECKLLKNISINQLLESNDHQQQQQQEEEEEEEGEDDNEEGFKKFIFSCQKCEETEETETIEKGKIVIDLGKGTLSHKCQSKSRKANHNLTSFEKFTTKHVLSDGSSHDMNSKILLESTKEKKCDFKDCKEPVLKGEVSCMFSRKLIQVTSGN